MGGVLNAQEVAISYEIKSQGLDQATMQLFLQSITDQDQPIRAINLSMALPTGCAKITGQKSIFSDAWTDFLQEVQVTDKLDLTYNNWSYSQRWQYGSADPGLPSTTPVIAPAQGKNPLMIMEISLAGNCIDKLYLEQQVENPVNQMGDENVLPINWTVIHTNTEMELGQGLIINVYPNPVVNTLHVSFDGERTDDYEFELFSIDGKRLMAGELNEPGNDELVFDLHHLPAAVYVFSVKKSGLDDEIVQKMKVIKK